MSRPVVSVNICMHNSSRYVGETLQSVFAQTFQDFEVVVVDDGSTDGSPDLIEREFPDARMTVVRQGHMTLRVARPVALAHSTGEYIAFLDSDDLWAPTKLERQVASARTAPEAGLIFSDCELIDASGRTIGRFSDQFEYGAIDLAGTRGHIELLQRGNFIGSPTPFAPAAAIRAVGGFHPAYRHVNDYELWLRLARRYPLRFIDEPLARYRIHETQFTQRHPEITLPEQCALLRPIVRSSSYPRAVRIAIGDNLLGQHRLAWRMLARQRRYGLALGAALGMCRYPDRLRDSWRHQLCTTPVGPIVECGIRMALRMRRAPRRLLRVLRGQEPLVRKTGRAGGQSRDAAASSSVPVWVDGSSLGGTQAGDFNLASELIRRLAQHRSPAYTVHVSTQAAGRAALLSRLGTDATRVRFHRLGWRAAHWSHIHRLMVGWQGHLPLGLASVLLIAVGVAKASWIAFAAGAVASVGLTAIWVDELGAGFAEALGRPRQRYAARFVRFLWRWLPAPRRRAPSPDTVEILFWRGRFKWRNSRRIAVVADVTTRILPELHTGENVAEFDELFGYVQRHAHVIATVSEHSRHDIIDHLAVCPGRVSVIPMPVHPQYVRPHFSRGFVAAHGIAAPYVLCVATVEPRKNLRRLVRAFEMLKEEQIAKGLTLVLAGPKGWDSGFREFLSGTDACSRVHMPGFVPLEHLPSLYHFASAVICPSVYEGFGLPVMEAMCCSAIVLASRVSSLPEVLGRDGIQFNPHDTEEMARALLSALTLSATEAAIYRCRCRQRAEAHLERLAQEGPLPGFAITPAFETT